MDLKSAKPIQGTRVQSLTAMYLESKPNLGKESVKTYKKQILCFFDHCSRLRIRKPNSKHAQEFIESQIYTDKSANYVNNLITGLRGFFSFLESREIYPNIFSLIKRRRSYKKHKRLPLVPWQFRKIRDAMPREDLIDLRNYAIFNLIGFHGLRAHAVCDLKQRDFIRSLARDGEQTYSVRIRLKGYVDPIKQIQLHEDSYQPILNYLDLLKLDEINQAAPLFASRTGRKLRPETISRLFKTSAKRVGINDDRISCHSLRHTFATVALAAGAPMESISDSLGHAELSTTSDIYAHRDERSIHETTQKVREILCG